MQDTEVIETLSIQRGLPELTSCLQEFVKHHYAGLPVQAKKIFFELLQQDDSKLYEWIILEKNIHIAKHLQNLLMMIIFYKHT